MAGEKIQAASGGWNLAIALEDCLPFFRLWTKPELEQATENAHRAVQARWPVIALVFLLWRWALENRKVTFEAIRPKCWPVIRKIMEYDNTDMAKKPVTAAAFNQARQKLGMEPLNKLHTIANEKVASQFDDMARFRGLRVWAVDGSWLNLPSRKELEAAFGRPSAGAEANVTYPQALLVCLDLVRLGWIEDYRLDRHDRSELKLAMELTEKLGHRDLLLGDRGFYDTRWFFDLANRHVEWLFRVTSNRIACFTEPSQQTIEARRRQSPIVDCKVDLKVDVDHHGRPRHVLHCRYVEIQRPGQETLRFITTLTDDFASAEQIARLYRLRWGIETEYRIFKGEDHLPVVLSRKENTVRQELLLRVLAHNSLRYVQAEACRNSDEQSTDATTIFSTEQPAQDHNSGADADACEKSNSTAEHFQGDVDNQPFIGSRDGPIAVDERQPLETQTEKWEKRHAVEDRQILPIDLRMGPTAALLIGNIVSLAIYPEQDPNRLYDQLLADVLAHEIFSKPDRHYPRRGKKYNQGKKKNKGNRKAQYQRRKQRDKARTIKESG